jgi:hypothetical protein
VPPDKELERTQSALPFAASRRTAASAAQLRPQAGKGDGGTSMMRSVSDQNMMMNPASRKSRHNAICATLAVVIGLGIGWLDLHTTEVIVTILALLLAGLLLGLLQPTAAWRWAVLLTLGLPAMAVIGRLLRVPTAEPIRLDPRVALVALAFALVGCYGGVAVRRIAARLTTEG